MRRFNIILCFCLIFILSGCNAPRFSGAPKILSPENNDLMIKGKWYVEDYKNINHKSVQGNNSNKYINSYIQINNNFLSLGGELYLNPKYKYRRVNAQNYFLNHHKIDGKVLGINREELEIFSVSIEGKPLYEFIKYSPDKILFLSDGVYYFANRRSNNTDSNPKAKSVKEESKDSYEPVNKNVKSGILIGLRSERDKDEDGNIGESEYRTLWISAINKNIFSYRKKPNIIFPRTSGFWELEVRRENFDGYFNEGIYINSYGNKSNGYVRNYSRGLDTNICRNIKFISNDYLGMEFIEWDKNNISKAESYVVLPVDNIQQIKGLKFSDILGEQGKIVQENSAKGAIASHESLKSKLETNIKEENFTMVRKNGHWMFKGRIDSKNGEKDLFLDYNINILPPKKFIFYDELQVPWNKIKERIPEAVDVYTSPNNDIAVVLTKHNLFVYDIYGGELGEKPLKKVKLKDGETVIMAEWALDDFVDKWDRLFKEQNH
ncbi:hypothetical protein [Clostridium amazonitimonense]|uniref:hypothetical protein n=1 Tax=Clostridium amazonitimonense TaxID=1499689 RepID=UPI000509FE9F|nr:hypothetical protein [Clostridium amazonitimonense]